jgi:outer membrane protein OmpA-like peptidoglycan-associated protein
MSQNISSPLEGIVVLRKKWLENRNLVTHLGGGAGLTNGYGAPDFRIITGVSYAWDLSRKEPREEVIRTNKIHFEFDRAVIRRESYPVLDNITAILKNRSDVEAIRVEGHTDSRGSDQYNENLSDRRANAVMDYLVSHGVPRSKLTAVGRGESAPLEPNEIDGRDNPAGRAENRRVEFHLSIRPGTKLKVIEEKQAPTFPEN